VAEFWTPNCHQEGGSWEETARNSLKTVVGPWRLERQTSTVSRLSFQSLTDQSRVFSKTYACPLWSAFGPHGPYLPSLDLTRTSLRVVASHLPRAHARG